MTPGQTLAELTGRVIQAVSEWCLREKADVMLVQGDTTTVLASSIAAFYHNVRVAHVEAGLRTGDMRSPFPEEMNRRLTTPLANWHFCPTEMSRQNLLREVIDDRLIHVTGNTVVDALLWVRNRLADRGVDAAGIAKRLGVPAAFEERFLNGTDPWILVTGHRSSRLGVVLSGSVNRLSP